MIFKMSLAKILKIAFVSSRTSFSRVILLLSNVFVLTLKLVQAVIDSLTQTLKFGAFVSGKK